MKTTKKEDGTQGLSYEDAEFADYLAYDYLYDEDLKQYKKQRPQATMPGKILHSGPPLDFSFLKLENVESLKKERPRHGKRKKVQNDEEEEDSKKADV